ncbi:hypothetical protein FRC02_008873 [Tulasnella sp. 418]|nr:hypothetical protein FRC02_008873 [Tulasnella sp. 418]
MTTESPAPSSLPAQYVKVFQPPAAKSTDTTSSRPAHHLNDHKNSFHNPWPSFKPQDWLGVVKWIASDGISGRPKVVDDVETQLRRQTPTWGTDVANSEHQIKSTWLGHACFLLELPTPEGSTRGARILFDPVFSHRCSPSQYIGPARYTRPPCAMEDIPPFEIIVISHNHYDHLDTNTIKTLERIHKPHIFAPLGNDAYFKSLNIPEERTHILDWWDTRHVTIALPGIESNASDAAGPSNPENSKSIATTVAVTSTPCQHFTGRGLLDRFKSLWSSWAIEDYGVGYNQTTGQTSTPGVKAWFAGDTGYRAVLDGEDEEKVPTCPEFKKIGERFGGFDLAFIPIGAYLPRHIMSMVHCAPQDSVRLFQDVRAKRAIGMHWGTWILTNEPVLDPPKRLAEECAKVGIAPGAFDVCGLGETVVV